MIDLHPATNRAAALIADLADEDLARPTPCPGYVVGDLVDHIGSLATAFAAAARKDLGPLTSAGPMPDRANLDEAWRADVASALADLADAWDDPGAWQGMTQAGAVDLPGEVAGLVALDEVLVHGWDVAIAVGRAYTPTDLEIEGALGFVASFDAPRDGALFGPVVVVPSSSSPFERLLGLTGRDPGWRPPL